MKKVTSISWSQELKKNHYIKVFMKSEIDKCVILINGYYFKENEQITVPYNMDKS